MKRIALALLLLAGCNSDPDADIAPLPPQTADTANQLMVSAQQAATEAQARTEPAPDSKRSTADPTNEVTP